MRPPRCVPRAGRLWLGIALAACSVSPAFALDVPVLVQELAPDGVPPVPQGVLPVSVGVPFGVEERLTGVDRLGMSGTSAAQFRVLQRDPQTGNITWVLATFVAAGGPYAVTAGNGDFGGAKLARDDGDKIVVRTGAATFDVRRFGFDLLDCVVVGKDTLVAPHAGGGIVVSAGGVQYASGLDTKAEVEIEDNGPVMAVVCARGVLRDATARTALHYTARLHFYAGQASCRAFVTLRNADVSAASVQRFDAAWVEMPLRLRPQREVLFGFPGSGFGGRLAAGDGAHLFQGDNVFQRDPRTDGITPYLTSAIGLEVEIAGQPYNAAGSAADVARGWMRLQDDRHAVLAGMRDMASLFPVGFDVTGDRLSIDLFSRYNPHHDLVFSWGAHETRELLFDFGAAGSDPERFRARLQYPQLGRCTFERYRDTGAVSGERRLVSIAEEQSFFAELGKTWRPMTLRDTDLRCTRSYSFGTTGGGNQFDQDECHLIDFLRGGSAGRFLQGRLGAVFKADQAVLHSDDFDFSTRQNAVSDVRVDQPAGFTGKGAGNLFDDEHPHWTCMALYYHLTGDEGIKEAIEDYGEWRQYRAGNPTYGVLWGGGIHHMRLWSRCIRDVALLYEITGDKRYLEHTRRMAQTLTTTMEVGASLGRNLDRGYFFFGDPADTNRRIHLFFLTEMNAIGVQEAMRVLPDDDPLREELRDYLCGLAWFTLQEAQVNPNAIGYPYEYNSAAATEPGVRGDQTGILLTHGYETSGDPEFVRRSRALAWHVPEYQGALRASELSEQLRIWRWLHQDETGATLLDPRAARNADGSWTLRWTTPPGAVSYVVKYGPRPLVETLGFDPLRREFRVDPANAMNFWAAKNVAGEPRPGPVGGTATFRTPVLPSGNWYFKVKVLTDHPIPPLAAPPLRIGNLDAPATSGQGVPQPAPGRGNKPAEAHGAHAARRSGAGPRASQAADEAPAGARVETLAGGLGARFVGLPARANVRVYSVAGRLVREITCSDAGEAVWDRRSRAGTPVAPGVYVYRVDSGSNRVQRGRIVLAR